MEILILSIGRVGCSPRKNLSLADFPEALRRLADAEFLRTKFELYNSVCGSIISVEQCLRLKSGQEGTMKCEKSGIYTILMDGKQWCPGCQNYHEPKLSNEDNDSAPEPGSRGRSLLSSESITHNIGNS
jgi:hypothetical protein